jgi:DNA-binding transcriptional ArsR family regulator
MVVSLRSDLSKKLLSYLFTNPTEEFYTQDLCRRLDLDKRNLVKKLHELTGEGLLACRKQGNLKLYRVDSAYPLYNEYRNIILKTAEMNGGKL